MWWPSFQRISRRLSGSRRPRTLPRSRRLTALVLFLGVAVWRVFVVGLHDLTELVDAIPVVVRLFVLTEVIAVRRTPLERRGVLVLGRGAAAVYS